MTRLIFDITIPLNERCAPFHLGVIGSTGRGPRTFPTANLDELVGVVARLWARMLERTPDTRVEVSVCGDRTVDTTSIADAVRDIERMLADEQAIRARSAA